MSRFDALVDGEPTDSLPLSDRGLQYGDGCFETIACPHGAPRFLQAHWNRLQLGCERLGFSPPDRETLFAEIARMAGRRECIVKVIVTRGSADSRGYAPPVAPTPRRIVQAHPWTVDSEAELHGVAVGLLQSRLADMPRLAGIKHLNRLEQVIARAELAGSDYREGLLLGVDGRVISATSANLFLLNGNVLATPRVDRAGIAGIMRGVVLREAAALGLSATERDIGLADLALAEELWLTNARIGLWSVVRLGAWSREAPGPLARRMHARIATLTE